MVIWQLIGHPLCGSTGGRRSDCGWLKSACCQFWDSYIVSIREGWTFNYCCVLLASQVEIVQSSFVFPISIALNIPSYLNSFCSLLSLLYSPTYAVVFLPNIIFFKCQVHVWHFGCMNSLIIQVEISVSGAFYYLAVFCSIY